jgi:hypothetical protein
MILIFTSEDTDRVFNKVVLKSLPLGCEIIKTKKSIGELNLLLEYIDVQDWSSKEEPDEDIKPGFTDV